MKLSNHIRKHNQLELSMTSMIDVVFLLLIFFLVTTTFMRPEQQVMSAIEVEESDSQDMRSELEPAIIDVVLRSEKVLYRLGAIRTNDIEEIRKVLGEFDNKADGAFVRVQDDVEFEYAARAVGVCRDAGFTSVSYLPFVSAR